MIPVSLVTGFLGSGKTTLIGHLLREPGLAGTLVIVNEFGEVGIDHDLLEASSDDTILLANGCLCCTIRGNLVDTLLDVQAQRAEGRLRAFDRVVVETSGVVDPAPVLGFVFGERRVAAAYRLGAVVATCDAVAGAALLERHPEATSQAVLADHLLITKSDIASPAAVREFAARLRRLNAGAEMRLAVQGAGIDATLLEAPFRRRQAQPAPHLHRHAHDDAHDGRFEALMLQATRPLARAQLDALNAAIGAAATPALLRLKGIVKLADAPGCGVVQASPGQVHPATTIDTPLSQTGSLVLITEGAPPEALLAALAPFGITPPARQHSL